MPTVMGASAASLLPVGGAFAGVLLLLLALRYLLLRRAAVWARQTVTRVDDLVIEAAYTPSLFWCVAAAIAVAVRTSQLDPGVRDVLERTITVLVVVSMTLVAAHVAGGAVTHVLRRHAPDEGVPGLGQAIVRGLVTLLGAMVVLNVLGMKIAPLLTALGVGGLAVALALQDTLSNFFAGIHILLERPYTVGHFIRLEDGQEGHVFDLGWRTTRIRTLDDDLIVVPNSVMARTKILNYHMPIRRSRVELAVCVDRRSDADHVRVVLEDVIHETAREVEYVIDEPPPEALLARFTESALEFHVEFFLSDVALKPEALDEVHRRVLRRLRKEGIGLALPERRVVLQRD